MASLESLEERVLPAAVQVDLSGHYNLDGVANRTAGADDLGDNPGLEDGGAFLVTNAFAEHHDPVNGQGLPDDGFFPASTYHPDIQLGYRNDDNGSNVVQLTSDSKSVAIDVPDGSYTQLHLVNTSDGESYELQLNYSDGNTVLEAFSYRWFDDIFDGESFDDAVEYNLVKNIDYFQFGRFQNRDEASVFGHRFNVDATRTLQSVTVTAPELSSSVFNLLGVTLVDSLYEVDVFDDVNNGNFKAGDLSLREAVELSNTVPGEDSITFMPTIDDPWETITLNGTELAVTDSVNILGPGAEFQTIDANNASRVFYINDSDDEENVNVTISGLTLTGGMVDDGDAQNISDGDKGGAVFSIENLTLRDSVITGNTAVVGGGVYNREVVTITGTQITGNTSSTNSGGFGNLGTAVVTDSSITDNTAAMSGGGIGSDGILTLTNSTVSGNTSQHGGGIHNFFDAATIKNSTIAGNTAQYGGGVYNAAALTIDHTIIAGNRKPNAVENDVEGTASLAAASAFSLIGNAATSGGLTDGNNHNIVGVDWKTVLQNDGVAPVSTNNGGNGKTITVLVSSDPGRDAVNAGDPAFNSGGLPQDQRGAPFARIAGGLIDIGAYERQTFDSSFFEVTTVNDELDYTNSHVSLREAVNTANGSEGTDTISFSSLLIADGYNAITLDRTELRVADDVTIRGPGAPVLTVSGNYETRILNVDDGQAGHQITVEISGLNLRHAGLFGTMADSDGGAVLSSENLTLRKVVVENNDARAGAGVFNSGGTLTIIDSTIAKNNASESGGGVYNDLAGQLTIIDGSFSGNRATLDGGGIFNSGTANLSHSAVVDNSARDNGAGIFNDGTIDIVSATLASNSATDSGGGIFNSGTATIGHSTIAGNIAANTGGLLNNVSSTVNHTIIAGNRTSGGTSSDVGGTTNLVTASAFNLIGNAVTAGGLADGGNGNIVGVDWKTVLHNDGTDPVVKRSGGRTGTIGLLVSADPNRDAVNGGDPAFDDAPMPLDQRGAPFQRIADVIVDIGAVERQVLASSSFEVTTTTDEWDYGNGDVSLREALNNANGSVGDDIIAFNAATFASPQTIDLVLGELSISDTVTISLPVAQRLTIDAHRQSRVINVHSFDGDVTLDGLRLTRGLSDASDDVDTGGGAIQFHAQGTLTVSNSLIDDNAAKGDAGGGGAIFGDIDPPTPDGRIVINDSVISGNSAVSRGGAIYAGTNELIVNNSTVTGNTASGLGGGLHTLFGTIHVNDSEISSNSAEEGGGIYNSRGDIVVTDSLLTGNTAEYSGGGIYANESVTTITGSTLSNNSANRGGAVGTFNAPVHITSSTISENSATWGGGVRTFRGDITLVGSTIASNNASYGGGIWTSEGDVTLTHSTISGNAATYGGGIRNWSGKITLTSSTLSTNSADYGGGAWTYSGDVTVTNSTISGNSATADGGGLYFDDSKVTIRSSTISSNTAGTSGGGIAINDDNNGETLTVRNSIIAGNTAPAAPDLEAPGAPTTNLKINHSLIGERNGTTLAESQVPDAITGNLVGDALAGGMIDPKLDPLADNGGPALTHAPRPDSPAIDAGDNVAVANDNLTLDQRGTGFSRMIDGDRNGTATTDMGAVEFHHPIDLVGISFDALQDHVLGGQTTVTFTILNTGSFPAGAFETRIVWSPNNIIGDADDLMVSGTVEAYSGLAAGASDTRTIAVQLDEAALAAHAYAADPAGQPVGSISTDISYLFLVIDTSNEVTEGDENNNSGEGKQLDSDDITLFPWDRDGDTVVTPLDALASIQAIGTDDPAADTNGDGIVSPLESLAAVKRIGLERNPDVFDDTIDAKPGKSAMATASPKTRVPTELHQSAQAGKNVSPDERERTAVAAPTPFMVQDKRLNLFEDSSDSHQSIDEMIVANRKSELAIDVEFSESNEWLNLI